MKALSLYYLLWVPWEVQQISLCSLLRHVYLAQSDSRTCLCAAHGQIVEDRRYGNEIKNTYTIYTVFF